MDAWVVYIVIVITFCCLRYVVQNVNMESWDSSSNSSDEESNITDISTYEECLDLLYCSCEGHSLVDTPSSYRNWSILLPLLVPYLFNRSAVSVTNSFHIQLVCRLREVCQYWCKVVDGTVEGSTLRVFRLAFEHLLEGMSNLGVT